MIFLVDLSRSFKHAFCLRLRAFSYRKQVFFHATIITSSLQEAQINYDDERKMREKLQMDVDSKNAEIEGMHQERDAIDEGQSISGGNDDGGGESPLDDIIVSSQSVSQMNQVCSIY